MINKNIWRMAHCVFGEFLWNFLALLFTIIRHFHCFAHGNDLSEKNKGNENKLIYNKFSKN
jgi:hypothetical protein